MNRPTLNPSLFPDADAGDNRPAKGIVAGAWEAACGCWKWFVHRILSLLRLLTTPIILRPGYVAGDDRSWLTRWAARIVFRSTFLALLVLGVVVMNVYLVVHPFAAPVIGPPIAGAVHMDRVMLQTTDGVEIESFLSPALDEKQLLRHGEVAVRAKWPVVVLIPDQRGDPRSMDRMIGSFHDAGYVVMLVRLRGTGVTDTPQTLGINERLDIHAAVAHLCRLQYVDSTRISLIGVGTGATAAMLARRDNAEIGPVFAYQPVQSFDDVLKNHLHVNGLHAACRWGFEIMYQVDADLVQGETLVRALREDLILLTNHPSRASQQHLIRQYLQQPEQQISATR